MVFFIPLVDCRIKDWLISDFNVSTTFEKNEDDTMTLSNGLISRTFLTEPGFTTVDYYSYEKKTSILRALSPEAIISLDGVIYNVGNIKTSMTRAYLNRTELAETIEADPDSFQYYKHDLRSIEAPFPYKPMRGAPKDLAWPPKGVRLDVVFRAPKSAPDKHKHVQVVVHYQIYDGIPLLSKWVSIKADQEIWNQVTCSFVSVEALAVNQPFSKVSTWDGLGIQNSDGPDNAYDWMYIDLNRPYVGKINWVTDPSQSSIAGSYQPLLNVTNSNPVPLVTLTEDDYVSFQVNELVHCTNDPTRKSLARNRLLRLLAPHTQENPIFFHMTDPTSKPFREAVDQLAEVGFEMIIYSFFSSFNMENTNETYIESIRQDVAYATSKGIEVGGYDLIVLDRPEIPKEFRITDANGNPGQHACLASYWYEEIYGKLMNFVEKTNLSMVETDGPYGGGTCSSHTHSHHLGYGDSIYKQAMLQEKMYHEFRKRNIYINAPDEYYYSGSNRRGLGYNENQYSLPRWMDLSVSRQTVFDRVYTHTPTSAWMLVPLSVYHSGGEGAAFEPLSKHLAALNFAFAQYMGAGIAACYRGNHIFDTEETKELVKDWVSFYKKYRQLVTSDVVRINRPDMQGIDAFMHVNWKLPVEKGLVLAFNPTPEEKTTILTIPMYYTGIRGNVADVSEKENGYRTYEIEYGPEGIEIEIPVTLDPFDVTWFKIKSHDSS